MNNESLSLYIHIPFCASHCHYCAFYSEVVQREAYEEYVQAICRELRMQAELYRDRQIVSIYFGGGTPSLLSVEQIARILDTCSRVFSFAEQVEITLEANPADRDGDDYRGYALAGINRLSLGVQTFADHLLLRLGRRHSSAQAQQSIRRAYRNGLHNISLDLMYGIPDQTPEDLAKSLDLVVHLPIQHVSVYGLSIEENTVFGGLWQRGALSLPDEHEEWQMYRLLQRVLPHYGLQKYEISNFARPGYESRHNLRYWQYLPYLGIGAGATGCIGGIRKTHAPAWQQYVEESRSGRFTYVEEEVLARATQQAEFCMLGLRMRTGIDAQAYHELFGESIEVRYGSLLTTLTREGWLQKNERGWQPTESGWALANQVMQQFL